MKNLFHKKGWNLGTNPSHVEPPSITLINKTYNGDSEKDFVKLKLRRDPMSSTSELYEFKISLFEHGDPEEFLLFICNFNMDIAAAGTLDMDVKTQYLCMIFRGETLPQFELLSADV